MTLPTVKNSNVYSMQGWRFNHSCIIHEYYIRVAVSISFLNRQKSWNCISLVGMYNLPLCSAIADLAKALKQGQVPAAYARVMFLGAGGSGKSSLLDGLMNIEFCDTDSTPLVDTRTVKYQWVQAADAAIDAWKPHSAADEMRGLAARSRQVVEGARSSSYIGNWESAPAVKLFDVTGSSTEVVKQVVSDQKYAEKASEILNEVSAQVLRQAMQQDQQKIPSDNPDVVLHIWDCGGQPVFLDIISAFLTSRTMFLLLFDASVNLNSMYREIWHHKGKSKLGREQNVTHLQLMIQWMQFIHASLVTKVESTQSQQSGASASLAEYPKAMMVGTHGDKITSKEAVLQSLQSACDGAAFSEVIIDKLIVDNTTAGGHGGKMEDPGYRKIRENIYKFAQSLVVPTPLAWVTFRKAMQ